MPLKLVRVGEIWHVTGTVAGRRVRRSLGTGDRDIAEEARAKLEHDLHRRKLYGEKGQVTFAEAAKSYLRAGPRSATTGGHVARLLRHFGTTPLREINQVAVDAAYIAILTPGATGATRKRAVLTPLCAILEHAARREWCERPAFEVPDQGGKPATAFLLPDQATALVRAATALEHRVLFTFLIGCGTRASEAFDLPWEKVDLRGARATVWQKQGNWRLVNLPPVVVAALASLPHREGFVFRPPARMWRGEVVQHERYADMGREGGGQVATAFGTACRRAGLPGRWVETTNKAHRYWQPEIRLHDLRHTWASWHYAMHKDPLLLMRDGGWSGLAMTARYAHLMPEAYVEEAKAWLAGGVAEAKRASG
jgi:integrase